MLRRLFGLRTLAKRILDSLRTHRRRTHVGQPDAPVAVHLLSRGPDDRPVEEPAAELDVLVRAVGNREDHLADQLVVLERGGEDVLEEVFGRVAPLVGDDLGVENQRQGRVVAGRVGVGHDATDAAQVADLVVADLVGDLGQDGQVLLDGVAVLELDVAHQRAHAELAALDGDVVELLDRIDVDQGAGLGEPEAHERDQAVAAGQHLGILAEALQQL